MHPLGGARVAARLFAALVLVAACSPSAPGPTPPRSSPGAPTQAPYARERTPWEVEMANVEPNGTPSLETALRMFAMAIGPVPGVDVALSAPGEIMSATPAIHAVRAHWDDLTPRPSARPSRATFTCRTRTGTRARGRPGSASSIAGAALFAPPVTEKQAAIATEVGRLYKRAVAALGDGPGSMQIAWADNVPVDIDGTTFISYGVPHTMPGGPDCTIIVTPFGLTASPPALSVSLAHDVFYCTAEYVMNDEAFYGAPRWVVDGAAHYFALSKTGADFSMRGRTISSGPTPHRSSSAVGTRSGSGRESPISRSATSTKRFSAPSRSQERRSSTPSAVAAPGRIRSFLVARAAGMYREGLSPSSGYGPAWNTDGPSLPADLQGTFGVKQLANDDVDVVDREPFTNIHYSIHSSADLLRFEFEGSPRLGDGKGIDTTLLASTVFCTRADGCPPCPTGPNPQQYQHLAQDSILAVSGGIEGTHGTISGERLPPCESPPPSLCPDGAPAAAVGGGVGWPCGSRPLTALHRPIRSAIDTGTTSGGQNRWGRTRMSPGSLPMRSRRASRACGPLRRPSSSSGSSSSSRSTRPSPASEEPYNIPVTGQVSRIENLPKALQTMHAYCGIPWPASSELHHNPMRNTKPTRPSAAVNALRVHDDWMRGTCAGRIKLRKRNGRGEPAALRRRPFHKHVTC